MILLILNQRVSALVDHIFELDMLCYHGVWVDRVFDRCQLLSTHLILSPRSHI